MKSVFFTKDELINTLNCQSSGFFNFLSTWFDMRVFYPNSTVARVVGEHSDDTETVSHKVVGEEGTQDSDLCLCTLTSVLGFKPTQRFALYHICILTPVLIHNAKTVNGVKEMASWGSKRVPLRRMCSGVS